MPKKPRLPIRIVASPIPALIGLVEGTKLLLAGNWFVAVTAFLLGVSVSFVFLVGPREARDFIGFRVATSITLVLGLLGVLFQSPAFDSQLARARHEAMLAFARGHPCQYSSERMRLLFQEGMRSCGMQGYADTMSAIHELQKGLYLPAEAALVDQVRAAVIDKRVDWCAVAYAEASQQCPNAFAQLSTSAVNALREASSPR